MKANKIERKSRFALAVTAILALGLLGLGLVFCYDKLKGICLEQCIIRDLASQVSVVSGKMVKPDVIAENLGLRKGANLALIDFEARRKVLLERVPNLKSIRIARLLPDRVSVVAEERTPVARICSGKGSRDMGLVVDTEGVVFVWQRGTRILPLIRETSAAGAAKGRLIEGRTRAALRLIEACREPEFQEFGILEVETSKRDFLVATFGNYSRVKILWEGMDEAQTPASRADLIHRLENLRDAMRAKVASGALVWNATIPNRIFADTQEKPAE